MDEQIAFWNSAAAARWVNEQALLDAMLRPFGAAALEAVRPKAGEVALDVGCGCGDTSMALADLVGAAGRVVGLDVSAPMLARARERCAGRSNVSFVEHDAASAPLEPSSFDLLFSRFGVMFFADPTRAFTNLRGALRPNGRLAFACWRPTRENPWASVPFEAVAAVLGRPEPPAPEAPGPFAFGDETRVRRILEGAGFVEVSFEASEGTVGFGATGSLDEAAIEISKLGPVARLLVDRDEEAIAQALAAVRTVLPRYASPEGGVRFPAAAWVVTARTSRM